MRIIWSMDGLLGLRSATTSFWHSDAVRGPSTPTAPAPLGRNVINNHIAKRAPSRHDDALTAQAQAEVRTEYRPEGLRFIVDLPLSR
jgi:hypothetical protein